MTGLDLVVDGKVECRDDLSGTSSGVEGAVLRFSSCLIEG